MKLVSLGQSCVPQFAIRKTFNQRGTISPFGWCVSSIIHLPKLISSNFYGLLDRKNIEVRPFMVDSNKTRNVPFNDTYNYRCQHEHINNDDDFEKFYDKLTVQVEYVIEMINDTNPNGFIITGHQSYDKVSDVLSDIRLLIPEHHKLLYCNFRTGVNKPVHFTNNIYTACMFDESFKGVTVAKSYGTSDMFKGIICDAFELPKD